jgi:putative protease
VYYARFLYEIGVDALIVQDTGLIHRLRSSLPDFELHASTQLSIHNGEGALYYTHKGIKRVVLARELSFEEIRYISRDLGVETEIFVHGALCISYSGQCLMSSILGGRSGNRGRCAQPCRLPYDLLDEQDESKAKAYLMSPKDITAVDNMDEILDSGVYSLKIEGRMKRPEYVAATVKYFREEIEGKKEKHHRENLLKVFNREGFSDGYFHGKSGRDMMSFNYPKNTGVPMGRVNRDGSLTLTEPLRKGDGLRVGEKGLTVEGIRNRESVRESADAGETVSLIGRSKLPEGTLYKTFDFELMDSLKRSHNGMYDRKITLSAALTFIPGKPAVLKVLHNGREYTRASRVVETPLKAPLSLDRIEEALKKSGESPFVIGEIRVEEFGPGFLPVKELNEMRRLLLEDMVLFETVSRKKTAPPVQVPAESGIKGEVRENLRLVSVSTKDQLKAALELGVKDLVLYPFYRGSRYVGFPEIRKLLEERPDIHVYIKVSNILRTELHGVVEKIRKYAAFGKISGIITGNAGVIRLLSSEFYIIGDYKLNLFNSSAIRFYEGDIQMSMISEELNRQELKELKNKDQYLCLVYGRQELMHSEYCPVGATVGGMNRETPCNEACMTQSYRLKDRIGEEFPVMTDIFCRSYIMNGKPKNLLDSTRDLHSIGLKSLRIDLTTETYDESKEIILAFLSGSPLQLESFNRGHYKRGVE